MKADALEIARSSSLAMIAACFRHQHPEAFGRDPVPGVILPVTMRYGRDEIGQSPPSEALPEERVPYRAARRSGTDRSSAGSS
jgi:hypothetical protein